MWHYDAMLWEAGGDILNADNTQAAFNSPAGVKALTTLQTMAVTDKSVFLDQQNSARSTNCSTRQDRDARDGPWALSSYPDVNYGVQIMPTFDGRLHQTIAGPDMWVMFDNGDGAARPRGSSCTWFTAAEQVKQDSMTSGHLPIRQLGRRRARLPRRRSTTKFPGEGVFAENLANVTKARPVITVLRPDQPDHGQAIVTVMLGQSGAAGGARRRRAAGRTTVAGRRVGEPWRPSRVPRRAGRASAGGCWRSDHARRVAVRAARPWS